MLILLPLLTASAEQLSRRDARKALDAVNAALYRLPDSGTLTWSTHATFRNDPHPAPCGFIENTLDLKTQELTTEVVPYDTCTDPAALQALEERNLTIAESMTEIFLLLHGYTIEQDRREPAWSLDEYTVFLLDDADQAELLHVDPETAIPVFSQGMGGVTINYAFSPTPDGAVFARGENILFDGSPETRIEADVVEVADGVWMPQKVDVYVSDRFVGDARFEDTTYTP